MLPNKFLHRAVICLSAGFLLLTTVQAQEIDNRANVYGGMSHYRFDSDWNLENDEGWILGGEVPIGERWGLALERWDVDSDLEIAAGEGELKYTRLGGNYHLTPVNGWQPYLGFGVGQHKMTYDLTGNSNSETAWDFGVGVKRFLTDNVFLRGDVKALKVTGVNNLDLAVNLGLGYAFGSKARPVAATPAPAPAPQPAADPDSDGDGVPDSRDRCANTPRQLAVDANGCPIMESSMASQQLMVNFDVDKSDIKTEYNDEIADFAQFMTTYANTSAVIEGHTDSDGADAYNQALSERRAQAVMNRLIQAHGIAASRLSAVGYGEQRPIAGNDSAANKARNRRIMAEVSVEVQEERRR